MMWSYTYKILTPSPPKKLLELINDVKQLYPNKGVKDFKNFSKIDKWIQ